MDKCTCDQQCDCVKCHHQQPQPPSQLDNMLKTGQEALTEGYQKGVELAKSIEQSSVVQSLESGLHRAQEEIKEKGVVGVAEEAWDDLAEMVDDNVQPIKKVLSSGTTTNDEKQDAKLPSSEYY